MLILSMYNAQVHFSLVLFGALLVLEDHGLRRFGQKRYPSDASECAQSVNSSPKQIHAPMER